MGKYGAYLEKTAKNVYKFDVVVIGAGPAGLMAGTAASERGLSTAIVDKNDIAGKKLLITGKGRCNVTNDCDVEGFMKNIRNGSRFMYSSLTAFDSGAVMRFFEDGGVRLKTERGNRVFPESDKSLDIRDALVRAAEKSGCRLMRGQAVKIQTDDGGVCAVLLDGGTLLECRGAIVATGGLSYPKTGSTGDGYALLKAVGHTVTELEPSLVPLICEGEECKRLEGLSLKNVKLTAIKDGTRFFSEQGEMIFTYFGISGPLVLTLSGRAVDERAKRFEIEIDLKPALDEATLDRRLLRDFGENLNREFKNSLNELLPQKIIPLVIEKSGIEPTKKVNSVTAKEREALVGAIKCFSLTVTGTRPIDEAVITAGGVELKQINPKTLESKIIKNLHVAGELLDVDAYTGGFNLGVAFATGRAAGEHILGD